MYRTKFLNSRTIIENKNANIFTILMEVGYMSAKPVKADSHFGRRKI